MTHLRGVLAWVTVVSLCAGCDGQEWASILARPTIVGRITEIDSSSFGHLRLLVAERTQPFGVADPSGLLLVTITDRSVLLSTRGGEVEVATTADLRIGRRVAVKSEFVRTIETKEAHGDTVVVLR